MIGWQNNPPMCGIATMYQFSSNPNCRTRADTLMGSLDTHFWNPDAWNPYPDPGTQPLKLGYCWLPSFYAPLEPRADLSDNVTAPDIGRQPVAQKEEKDSLMEDTEIRRRMKIRSKILSC